MESIGRFEITPRKKNITSAGTDNDQTRVEVYYDVKENIFSFLHSVLLGDPVNQAFVHTDNKQVNYSMWAERVPITLTHSDPDITFADIVTRSQKLKKILDLTKGLTPFTTFNVMEGYELIYNLEGETQLQVVFSMFDKTVVNETMALFKAILRESNHFILNNSTEYDSKVELRDLRLIYRSVVAYYAVNNSPPPSIILMLSQDKNSPTLIRYIAANSAKLTTGTDEFLSTYKSHYEQGFGMIMLAAYGKYKYINFDGTFLFGKLKTRVNPNRQFTKPSVALAGLSAVDMF
nr:MAG: 33.1KD protein [Nilaparvata lugens reovirus]UHR49955.1 MAG: 33.1KD protein [Nilaparvata lugens reovirus]